MTIKEEERERLIQAWLMTVEAKQAITDAKQAIDQLNEVIRLQKEIIDWQKIVIQQTDWQRDYYKENYEALKMQMEGR